MITIIDSIWYEILYKWIYLLLYSKLIYSPAYRVYLKSIFRSKLISLHAMCHMHFFEITSLSFLILLWNQDQLYGSNEAFTEQGKPDWIRIYGSCLIEFIDSPTWNQDFNIMFLTYQASRPSISISHKYLLSKGWHIFLCQILKMWMGFGPICR